MPFIHIIMFTLRKNLNDKKQRYKFKHKEIKKTIYKYITSNIPADTYFDNNSQLRLKTFFLLTTLATSTQTKIQNRCILSGRSKSVYRKFKLSRIQLKKLAQKGQFSNLQKK